MRPTIVGIGSLSNSSNNWSTFQPKPSLRKWPLVYESTFFNVGAWRPLNQIEGRFNESMRSNRIQFKQIFPSLDLKKWSSWHLAITDRTRQIFISGAAYHQIIDSNSIFSRKREFFGPENDFSGKDTSIDLEFAEFRKKALNSRRSAWKMVSVRLCQYVLHSSKLWAWTTRNYEACTFNLNRDFNIG